MAAFRRNRLPAASLSLTLGFTLSLSLTGCSMFNRGPERSNREEALEKRILSLQRQLRETKELNSALKSAVQRKGALWKAAESSPNPSTASATGATKSAGGARNSVVNPTSQAGPADPKGREHFLYSEIVRSYEKQEWLSLGPLITDFDQSFPNSEWGDRVLLIRAQYAQTLGKPQDSLAAINDLLAKYPLSEKVPGALFMKTQIFARLNLEDHAVGIYQRLAKNYPKTREGAEAQRRLQNQKTSTATSKNSSGQSRVVVK